MPSLPAEWRPLKISEIAKEMDDFEDWVLCGGHSVALLTGRDTRSHGDVDIGIFRSQLLECLRKFDQNRVFLCRNGHIAWDGCEVPQEVHDIWITDNERKFWALQVMVYDDDGDHVVYRRDRRIRWHKKHHYVMVDGLRVLNPFITFLFKAQSQTLQEKEVHDLIKLIEMKP